MKKLILFLSMFSIALFFTGCQNVDKRGFDKNTGIHTVTKGIYDKDGYDIKGLDKEGFDKNAFHYIKTLQIKNYDETPIKNTTFNGIITVERYIARSLNGIKNDGYSEIGKTKFILTTDDNGDIHFDTKIMITGEEKIYVNEYNYCFPMLERIYKIELVSENYYSDICYGDNSKIYLINKDNHDYFDTLFLSDGNYHNLIKQIDIFLSELLLKSLIKDSQLTIHSIKIKDFKNNKYLSFSFKNSSSFNSLKLSKYDISKKMFDDIIRQLLSPINDNIGNSNDIFGYEINIETSTRDFSSKTPGEEILKYQFYLSKEIVSKYKNKDITGQQLIDQSIVLLNDERIDLKFQ